MGNNQGEENALAAISGAGLSALVWWDRLDRRTQQRLYEAKDSAVAALAKFQALVTSADFVRLYLPVVRDAIVGTALASAQLSDPKPVPMLPVPPQRPNLSVENSAAKYTWPPVPGVYDDVGNVATVGELSSTFLALTYEEVRAAVVGLAQKEQLSGDGLRQVHRAFNQLIAVVGGLGLTAAQYAAAWQRLFAGIAATGQSSDPHSDPTKPPTISILDPSLQSATALSSAQVPGAYSQPNTDAGFRFRITAVATGVVAGTIIARITFGTEYKAADPTGVARAFQPVVLITPSLPAFLAVNLTSSSFDLQARDSLSPGQSRDVFGAAIAGQVTV